MRSLVGHGIGRAMHEEPQIPNYGPPGKGIALEEGMVLAVEPMVTAGRHMVRMGDDGWAIYSQDGSLAAHFEFTIAITADGPRILTPVAPAQARAAACALDSARHAARPGALKRRAHQGASARYAHDSSRGSIARGRRCVAVRPAVRGPRVARKTSRSLQRRRLEAPGRAGSPARAGSTSGPRESPQRRRA